MNDVLDVLAGNDVAAGSTIMALYPLLENRIGLSRLSEPSSSMVPMFPAAADLAPFNRAPLLDQAVISAA